MFKFVKNTNPDWFYSWVQLLPYLLTYCPSCHRQLGQQQIPSISGSLEPRFVRCPMNVLLLSPLPQHYVSMSSLNARIFCVPLVSIRLLVLLLGWSLWLRRSWFEIFCGQTILTIFWRFLAGKDDNFERSLSVMYQHYELYNRVERTQLLYNFNFVWVLYCCDFHTGLSILKAFLALPILFLMLFPAPLLCLTVLPRYVICCVYGKGSSSTLTGMRSWTFRVITSVFLLILRPTCFA